MANDFQSRAPDFNLAMIDGNQRNPSIGSAWTQPDGSLSIKLHPGVVIRSSPTVKLRLFPKDFVPKPRGDGGTVSMNQYDSFDNNRPRPPKPHGVHRVPGGGFTDDMDDDIPF